MADLNSIGGIHYEMMRRCYNEKSVAYKDYGAKGITVCDEWHDREKFRKWAKENGYVKGLRLERIDTKGNYEPANCIFGENKKKKVGGKSQYHKNIRKHRLKMIEECGLPDKYCKLRIYRIYAGMHSRCENENCDHYKDYGGRGITVCSQWSGKDGFFHFYKWAMENGYNNELSIDRIDNDKGYYPDNCRWANVDMQINNRRTSRKYEYNGILMSINDIAKMNNISYGNLYNRIVQKEMTVHEALKDISKK